MRSRGNFRCLGALLLVAQAAFPATLHYDAPANISGSWPAILSSIGLTPGKDGVVVAAPEPPAEG